MCTFFSRKTLRNRKSLMDSHERRKSRRHSTGTSPLSMTLNARLSPRLNNSLGLSSLNNTLNSSLNNTLHSSIPDDDDESSSSQSSQGLGDVQMNGSYKENKLAYSGIYKNYHYLSLWIFFFLMNENKEQKKCNKKIKIYECVKWLKLCLSDKLNSNNNIENYNY